MTFYEVCRICHDVYCDEKIRSSYKVNKNEVLQSYELTAEELQALRDMDIKRLSGMGVHGLLLWHLAASERMSESEYLGRLRS